MMRIQLVCQFGEPVRGLSPYSDALSDALDRIDGIEVARVDFRHPYPAFLHPAAHGDVPVHGDLSWFNPASWQRVARRPADIMHIQHWAPPLATYLWPLARMATRAGKPVIITVHNPSPHERSGLFGVLENKLLRSADILLVHGDAGCRLLGERLGPIAPCIRRIAHGMRVMPEPAAATPDDYARLGLDARHRYVLLFGNLRGYKGVDALLDAWKLASPQVPDAELVIAGRLWGGQRHVLGTLGARLAGTAADAVRLRQRLSCASDLRNVVLREGFLSDADIDALIRISAFSVFPYVRFSGQSGAACRAAAMGRAVLVSRVGALPDLAIDDSWVLDPGDVEGLAVRLVQKLAGATALRAAGARQLDAVRSCDWQSVARDHARIYRELA